MLEFVITFFSFLITLLVGLITAAVVYARWHYGTLEKIKGLQAVIKPYFVGGSDPYIYKKVVQNEDAKNVQKYGKIYGYYEGREPQIFIADPEIIRFILVKDFDHFRNKRISEYEHELLRELLDVLPYEKWKVVRGSMSPTLTTGKIKYMSVAMAETIESWMETVKQKLIDNEQFTPSLLYRALTSDVVVRCGFGTKLNSLDDPNNGFVQHLKTLALDEMDINFLLTVTQVFPFLAALAPFLPSETMIFLKDVLKNMMKERKSSTIKHNDFVDCLNEMMEKLNTEEYKKLGITETTVMCQAISFFIAGFETTASTLTYLTYNLAKNPDIQEKLVAEIDDYLARHKEKIEHETINELKYMAACIQETLRMFPPAIRLERVCNENWCHEPTGLEIPKGMVIQVPVPAIHYNEEYYPEPYEFRPERFLPENKQLLNPNTFLSFGAGNRNCIGIRFAKEELHLVMVNVLKNFTFKANDTTKINYLPGRTFLLATEPFTVDAIKRYKNDASMNQ